MNINLITNESKIDFDQWNVFVENHPYGNFFQSPYACNFFNTVPKHSSYVVFAKVNEKIVGVLSGYIIREKNGFLGTFSSRCIIYGGPLVENNDIEISDKLLRKFDEIINCKSIYIQVRNMFDVQYLNNIFNNLSYIYTDHLNYLTDLTQEKDILWKKLSTKKRNRIRKAEKAKLSFKVTNSFEDLKVSHQILVKLYKRLGIPYPDLIFFEKLNSLLGSERFKNLLVLSGNKIIGFLFGIIYNGTFFAWYRASLREYYNKCPNDFIIWNCFLWCKSNGINKFDFAGAGKPGEEYGVRDFKKQFGGELVNYGRYEKIQKPLLFKIGKVAMKLYKSKLFS